MPTLQGEPIALAIREHQIKASGVWPYRDLVRELHAWVDRVDKDFDLGLPTPIIAIAPLRINILGAYTLGRNEIGARTTITLNERWLPHRSFSETAVTLVHELLHAFEEWRLGREVGPSLKPWYHTNGWREKMLEVGIVADEHGHTIEVLPKFMDYLKRYGVSDLSIGSLQRSAPSKRRQMPKWLCGCEPEKPVRGIRLRARCLDCGQLYRSVGS